MRNVTMAVVVCGALAITACGGGSGTPTAPSATAAAPSGGSASAEDAARGATTIQGFVAGVRGSCPNLSISSNNVTITTSARTTFENTSCERLKTRDQIEVSGSRSAASVLAATRVKKL